MFPKINIGHAKFPDSGEVLIYFIFEKKVSSDKNVIQLDRLSNSNLLSRLKRQNFQGKIGEKAFIENVASYEAAFFIGAGSISDFNLTVFRDLLSENLRLLAAKKYSRCNFFYFKELQQSWFELGKNLGIAFHLSRYYFDKYKGEEKKKDIHRITELNFFVEENKENLDEIKNGIDYAATISDGIYLARDLVNEPASYLHPDTLVAQAFEIEKESKGKIEVEILDEDECRRLGMGAFLGVAKGSDRQPKFIILSYKKSAKLTRLCLIGKSIVFDSGGLSLKPSEAMEIMKCDMAGGAAVLGVFKILANLSSTQPFPQVYGILPVCENMPSGRAIKPGDIVRALNGKTIEVLNTDAEGRLVLADALSYAEKYLKPDVIIDIATLTGACMVALGRDISGLFSNDKQLEKKFTDIAKKEGEQFWPLPLYKPYGKYLKSEIADLKNVGGGKYGGAITAAIFLGEFLKATKWIHLDIAGPAYRTENASGIMSHGGTGCGVLTLLEFIKKI